MKNLKLFLSVLLISFLSFNSIADTIPVQMPGGVRNYCQTPGHFDTFVFYKPLGFGSTMWRINNILVGSGDSLIYVPVSAGNFSVRATWNSNIETCNLTLFSSAPASTTLFVNSGGILNTAKDTVFLCSGAAILATPTANADESTYWSWTGPNGFSSASVGGPVTVSIPGTYVRERGNPCGVTRDTFHVVTLPYVLPDLGNDRLFCNQTVDVTLDAGPGYVYNWTGGATTQTLHVTQGGSYTVNVSNVCITGDVTVHVEHQSFPLPDLSYLHTTPRCSGDVVVLDPSLVGYTYDSYYWSNNATTPTISVTSPSNLYSLEVTKGSCMVNASVQIDFYTKAAKQNICIATVDVVSGKNKVVWENVVSSGQEGFIESYNVYKLNGTYTLIGNVPTSNVSSFVFTDLVSNPASSSVRYKVAAVDTCGSISDLSFYHQTIKINSNAGTSGSVDLTITDRYKDESGLYEPTKYYVFIDSLNNGSLHLMDSIDAVFNSYTIDFPKAGATYVMGVSLPWTCGDGSKSLATKQMSYSNVSSVSKLFNFDISAQCW
ncbi:MAG: hypothetical protein WCK02_01570, partial [Bacteroidota bacterium]